MSSSPVVDRFSLVAGGPFHKLLDRLGLIGADGLPTRRAAVYLALLAWLPLALLATAQTLLSTGYSGWGFFTDLTVPARYIIAIWVMVATARYADGRFVIMARQFREAQLLSPESLPAFEAALATADRRSSSPLVEGILVAVVLIWSGLTANYAVALAGSSWEGTAVDGAIVPSWAGEAARFVSNPLFLFLALRWFWWFVVWAGMLWRLSRLPLQMTVLHPDRAAGLGFLAIYPSVFSGFAFALSCVIASAMLKELDLSPHAPETVWLAMAGWMAINLVLFLGPLLVFVGPLSAVRERALLTYGRLANQHHLSFERRWITEARSGEDLLTSSDASSVANVNACIKAVQEMRFVPVDGAAVVQLVAAAGLPLLAVAATLVPLRDLVEWLVGKVL